MSALIITPNWAVTNIDNISVQLKNPDSKKTKTPKAAVLKIMDTSVLSNHLPANKSRLLLSKIRSDPINHKA